MSREAAPRTATPLAEILVARIAREGPLGVADYMQACLHDPAHGYYRKQTAIGRGGDFITAPEISQVFGELIGLWCAVVWQQMGTPAKLRLIELGPGRGTLIRDALRAARLVPDFVKAGSGELVESNATLIAAQREVLADVSAPLEWRHDLEPGSDPAIVLANEFLDTLPVTQWVYAGDTWRQRRVGLDASGALAFDTSGTPDPDFHPPVAQPPVEGAISEARDVSDLTAKLHALAPVCAALFIDYGHAQPGFGDTLQAISGHAFDDPLRAPGEADLTAHVDFAAFSAAARSEGFACDGPLAQGEFLGRLGIVERASRLMAANAAQAGRIEAGVTRLLSPGGMGSRFLALGLRSPSLPPLPGFEPVDSRAAQP
jgi:SAM-dependent MidA family methyltransferase